MYVFKRDLQSLYSGYVYSRKPDPFSYDKKFMISLFYIPHWRTYDFRKFSIRFQGPKFFNSRSRGIQNSKSIGLFVKRLKKFLLS